MNLREIVFTGGQVVSLRGTPEGLTIHFRLDNGVLAEIIFSGSIDFEIHNCFDYTTTRSTLTENDGHYRLTIFGRLDFIEDTEEDRVLTIDFAEATYKVV